MFAWYICCWWKSIKANYAAIMELPRGHVHRYVSPTQFFLHQTKKLDMSYSEINHNFFTGPIQTIESPGVHQLMRKKSNNCRVVGTSRGSELIKQSLLVTWGINNNLLKNIYDEDNEMEMMIANYGTVMNEYNTLPVYIVLLWSYWFHTYVQMHTYSHVHRHTLTDHTIWCTDLCYASVSAALYAM